MIEKYLKNSTLLLIEDDQDLLNNLTTTLENIGITVIKAINGIDGLKQYEKSKEKIDIIVTDIIMSHMDGIEMIKAIRETNFEIPIVVVSALDNKETLQQVINLNIDGFINKPMIIQKLLDTLQKALKPVYYKRKLREKDLFIFQQSKFTSIGEMIGNIAHQWRQPLNSIGSLMTRLEVSYDTGSISKELIFSTIEKTNTILEHMSKTIDDFRNFFSPNKEKTLFKLEEIVQSIILLFTIQLKQNNIQIKTVGNQKLTLCGFSNELKQVFINIISNSRDAIIHNNIKNGEITIRIKESENTICISIEDNAKGVKKENIDKIFDPYFTTKFKSQGTGLGLYISKLIVEKSMHGILQVSNTKKGASFLIKLPKN
jgi:signal transduction histidine kinase